MKPTLLYLQDTLCGWCYGFGPVMRRVQEIWSDRVDIQVMAGGMVVGERVGTVGDRVDVLRDAYRRIGESTGAVFGTAYVDGVLEEGTAILDSVPGAKALMTFKTFDPERAVGFAHRLQQAIYRDGMSIVDEGTFAVLAEEYGLDVDEFLTTLHDEQIAVMVDEEFAFVSSMGISGFPTVILVKEDQAMILAEGYATYEEMEFRLDLALKAFDQSRN